MRKFRAPTHCSWPHVAKVHRACVRRVDGEIGGLGSRVSGVHVCVCGERERSYMKSFKLTKPMQVYIYMSEYICV